MPTTDEKKARAREYYQNHKDWICAYQYARRHELDVYDVCRERGVEVPDTYEKYRTETKSREEILALERERQNKKTRAIRIVRAFVRRFIAKKREKERKAKQTEEEAKEKNRRNFKKWYDKITDLAEIVGCSRNKMSKMTRHYHKATGRSVFSIPDYFKDIPIVPYFTDDHWKVLESL